MASAKKVVLDLVKSLPDEASLEGIQYQLFVRQKLARSAEALAAGRTKTHEQVKKRLAKWFAR
jgi:hypothetical protein